jgi:hypothetical protein
MLSMKIHKLNSHDKKEQEMLVNEPITLEMFADNGAHNHWILIDSNGRTISYEFQQSQKN